MNFLQNYLKIDERKFAIYRKKSCKTGVNSPCGVHIRTSQNNTFTHLSPQVVAQATANCPTEQDNLTFRLAILPPILRRVNTAHQRHHTCRNAIMRTSVFPVADTNSANLSSTNNRIKYKNSVYIAFFCGSYIHYI